MSPALFQPITGLLLLAMPLILLASALPSVQPGAPSARKTRTRVARLSLLALFLALLADTLFLLGAQADLILPPLPWFSTPIGLSVAVNGITLLLATLVSFVLAIIARFSIQYLDGDHQQARFFRLLALTGGWFLLVVIAGNMAQFTLAIIATGFSLHRLLSFYPDRPRAIMVTHKKSIFSRSADALLVVATLLIGQAVGSLEFSAINDYVATQPHLPLSMQLAAWLVVFAALLKSAQFPFHGWLIQVMEAPTPVSALMHAGVVYSGAIIVLRLSHLLAAEGHALALLAVVGLITLIIASLVMLTQTAIKSSLAWSTTAQLGFMLLELGLGLLALGLLHLVGHSLYKAHAFLSSGGIADQLRQVKVPNRRRISVPIWGLTVAGGMLLTLGIAQNLGLDLQAEPALLALVTIIALATVQLVLKTLSYGSLREVAGAMLIASGMATVYFVLHEGVITAFGSDLAPWPNEASPLQWGLIASAALGFLLIAWLQGPGRDLLDRKRQTALFIHLYNGLYIDRWVERLAYRLWPEKVGRVPAEASPELAPRTSGTES
ncbi:NADH-quinone oxidoreductase subunit L [Halothiobacillus sp. DCM-1]|uniref:NADH-quinone oxidoreductase subunit L n=1 Tax=Halothiobacillus sp. DCM-1 TaxID=3112558 RepID=UPI00324737A9